MTNGKSATVAKFYSYMLMYRSNDFNVLLRGRRLLQQYCADQAAKMESNRLSYTRMNQKQIRTDSYQGLHDAVEAEDGNNTIATAGSRIILPSTFTGGPRYIHEKQQDAMAYVQMFGRPDFFLTFTCNPKALEIMRELFPGQTSPDRPDIVSRVFHL